MWSVNSRRSLRLVGAAAAVLLGLAASSAQAGSVLAFLTEQTNDNPSANAVGVQITVADAVGGVQFTAQVLEIPGLELGEGDVLAVWFDVVRANLDGVEHSPPYIPTDLDITGFVKDPNNVGSDPFGQNGPNIEGMPSPFSANTPYDMAIRFGSNGMGQNYYPTVSFLLTGLTTADFSESRFAARVTSIGTNNEDSGKYGGFGNPVPTPSAAMGGVVLAALAATRRWRPIA